MSLQYIGTAIGGIAAASLPFDPSVNMACGLAISEIVTTGITKVTSDLLLNPFRKDAVVIKQSDSSQIYNKVEEYIIHKFGEQFSSFYQFLPRLY